MTEVKMPATNRRISFDFIIIDLVIKQLSYYGLEEIGCKVSLNIVKDKLKWLMKP